MSVGHSSCHGTIKEFGNVLWSLHHELEVKCLIPGLRVSPLRRLGSVCRPRIFSVWIHRQRNGRLVTVRNLSYQFYGKESSWGPRGVAKSVSSNRKCTNYIVWRLMLKKLLTQGIDFTKILVTRRGRFQWRREGSGGTVRGRASEIGHQGRRGLVLRINREKWDLGEVFLNGVYSTVFYSFGLYLRDRSCRSN